MPKFAIRGALAALLCAAQTLAHAAPTLLQRAQLEAHEHHLLGVGVLVLDRSQESDLMAAMMQSRATRFALREFDLVVLRPRADGRYRVERLPGECDGIDPCAQELFIHALDAAQARALAQGHLRTPVLVVYPANGDPRPSGVAFGFDNLETVVRFARAVRHASPGQPALFEDRRLLSGAP